ncbi:LLM class flavin-dependent oxidoreductase [Kitasatospora cineracea]|uniref:Alkanesulfonate monooxygenase n=1 Tax=Kitasatospora cineracea TaxID=88074 RepID=A0A3N4RD82_9ACTN|nr:LLM class flavin-dependent oxidoreductase [Kitasatospora cineracea]RPE28631.1 alkanesulfonate monooxygenase [Kitasatospora cineracea]
MELELRGGVRAAPVAGRTPAERQALRWAPDPRERTADPAHIARTARELEEDGLDSALVVQSSSWPDPWAVAGWALAATTRLRIAAAHRIGTTPPTTTARTLATLDRLSGGRISAHLIIGSSDADVARDGDTLPKAERYRRADEYLSLLTRYLAAEDDLDHHGEYYTVRAARTGLRPAPGSELLSFGGSSPAGVDLAARYAQVYAVPPRPLPDTRLRIAQARAAAARHGRTLRIWRHVTVVLADTDTAAQQHLRRLRRDALRLTSGPDAPRYLDAVALDRDRERAAADPATDPAQVAAYIRRSLAGAHTGSPATVAARINLLRSAGVDIVQLDLPVETDHDRDLRRALIAHLRDPAPPRRTW